MDKMERQLASAETIKSWIKDHPQLCFDGTQVSCTLCCVNLLCYRKSNITQHVSSRKHQAALIGGDKQKLFNMDLVKFMISCNIPWNQLENPEFCAFVDNCIEGKYRQVRLPSSSTLKKSYLPQVAESIITSIQSQLKDEYIWLSIDETTNASGRRIVNVLVGALSDLHATRGHLMSSKELNTVDANSVCVLVNDTLRLLWGDNFNGNTDKFLLFITDTTAHMKAAGRILQEVYNVLHITCVVHTLHHVAETVKECYPTVDMLISSVKKVFNKAPERERLFFEILPHVDLPPEPVSTRWGAWIEAATYYFIHLESMKQVLQRLDPNQGVVIAKAQKVISDSNLPKHLKEIHNFFSRIPLAIRQLECNSVADNFSLIDEMNIVYDLKYYISQLQGETAERVKQKLEYAMQINPGFRTLSSIVKLLRKEEVDFDVSGLHKPSLYKYSLFRYAPVTVVDIERLFSLNKWIFSERRRRLTSTNLEQILIIYFNFHSPEKLENSE